MRFAGRVSADRISMVSVGQAVGFRINGYAGQEFRGKVTRVDPSANDVTRQVEVLVSFADAQQPRVSGLYAEGTIEATNVKALTLPESMLVRAGDKASVWRLRGNTLNLVELTLGARDPRTGNYEIRGGLAEGDTVLRSPSSSFREGQTAHMVSAKPVVGAAPAPAPAPAASTASAPVAAQGK
jgi:multidrug efflux pump subunit AcrA (membrane-fusion protein)